MPQVCGGKKKGIGILNGSGLFLPVDVTVVGSACWRGFCNREGDLTGRCRNLQTANVRFEP
jgi:hypothetical protein